MNTLEETTKSQLLGQTIASASAAAAPSRPRGRRARNHQGGVSLLESLVSIVVLSLGILGILGMQLRTLADAQTSVRRAQAIRLIDDLSERLRANPNTLVPTVATEYVTDFSALASSLTKPSCATGTGCTASDQAKLDIATWKENLEQILPGGQAAVFMVKDESGATENRRQLGVMVAWREAERVISGQGSTTELSDQFKISATSASDGTVTCPDNMICHLDYIALAARCMPDASGSATVLRCADGAITVH